MENIDRSSHQSLNILLVEDNETDQKLTLRAFAKSKLKNNIYTAGDGEEALNFVLNRDNVRSQQRAPLPDFILMDIKMPKMDGLEALRQLKEHPEYKRIPVAILTSSVNEEDVRKSYENGAVTYIPKPLNYDKFSEVIDHFNVYWHKVAKLSAPSTNKN